MTHTPLSSVLYEDVGAGVKVYTITFTFLQQAHVSATIDGTDEPDFTINAAGTTLTFGAGVTIAGGEDIKIIRTTPNTPAGLIIDFAGGSALRADDLDTAQLQLLYIAQETIDIAKDAEDLLVSAQTAAEDLPSVSGSDNNSGLFVDSGVWAKRTPAQVRTHLALGSSATVDVGTGASEIVQRDGSGDYPAGDASAIDLSSHSVQTDLDAAEATIVTHTSDISDLRGGCAVVTFSLGVGTLPVLTSGTWYEDASSRMTPTQRDALNNSGSLPGSVAARVEPGGKAIELGVGDWLVTVNYMVVNNSGTVDATAEMRVADEPNDGTQVSYGTGYDAMSLSLQRVVVGTSNDAWAPTLTFAVNVPSGSKQVTVRQACRTASGVLISRHPCQIIAQQLDNPS